MALGKSTNGGSSPLVVRWTFVSLCVVVAFLAQASTAQNVSVASSQGSSTAVTPTNIDHTSSDKTEEIDYGQVLRDVVAAGISKVPRSLMSKLLSADLRFECTTALLRTMRAIQNFEPWAMRLLDATGKYPSGFFEASRSDMGAFDECLETAVRDRSGKVVSRGQYCNLLVYAQNATTVDALTSYFSDVMPAKLVYYKGGLPTEEPLARIALCYIDDCNQHDLQAMVDALNAPRVRLEISNCVTAEPRPWSKTQLAIVISAAILLVVIIISTLVDIFVEQQSAWRKKHGLLFEVAVAFSVTSNTRILLHVPDKDHAELQTLQFFHGVRSFAIVHIVLGHIHEAMADSFSRLLSLFEETSRWEGMLVSAAFNGVDTFFFLSGFFLCHVVRNQKGNGVAVFIIAVIRRLIRICVPFFFIIMWFYLLPRFVNGPDAENFFQKFYVDVSQHWWQWLAQIRNFFNLKRSGILEHSWYLSADFQLFVVSLLTLLAFRRRKTVALAALAVLSLLGCAIATWAKARWHLLPFVIMPYPNYTRMMDTLNYYYVQPFYHAVCYFSGCMTCMILTDLRDRKISKPATGSHFTTLRISWTYLDCNEGLPLQKLSRERARNSYLRYEQTLQLAGWCVSVSCGLFCVFIKLPWYSAEKPASDSVEMTVAFFDRILWSICLTWITVACSTGRGGPVNKFLSWNAFVPLSKLSYGVYLIHMPLMELLLFSSRERISFAPMSRVTFFFALLVWNFVLAYLAFVACEGPTAALDKLIFSRLMRGGGSRRQERQEQLNGGDMTTSNGCAKNNEISRC